MAIKEFVVKQVVKQTLPLVEGKSDLHSILLFNTSNMECMNSEIL